MVVEAQYRARVGAAHPPVPFHPVGSKAPETAAWHYPWRSLAGNPEATSQRISLRAHHSSHQNVSSKLSVPPNSRWQSRKVLLLQAASFAGNRSRIFRFHPGARILPSKTYTLPGSAPSVLRRTVKAALRATVPSNHLLPRRCLPHSSPLPPARPLQL